MWDGRRLKRDPWSSLRLFNDDEFSGSEISGRGLLGFSNENDGTKVRDVILTSEPLLTKRINGLGCYRIFSKDPVVQTQQ